MSSKEIPIELIKSLANNFAIGPLMAWLIPNFCNKGFSIKAALTSKLLIYFISLGIISLNVSKILFLTFGLFV